MKKITSKLAIAFILLSLGCNQVVNKISEDGLRKILPPIPDINIGLDNYIINAEEGGTIMHSTGTLISIPANAFVDKNGNSIKGDVEIQYREMHTLSEIFVSGIPMTYDSAGTEYHFESAGMNEIKGFKDGEPIFINKNKSIDISMKSDKEDSKFNLYYYDTIQNQWINKGKDVPVTIDETEIEEPAEPLLADSSKKSFSIHVDLTEFPELKVFENTIFQLTDNNENKISPEYSDRLWHNVEIEKGKCRGTYNISFTRYDENINYEVCPVYDSANIDQAIALYEEKFEMYKTLLLAEIEKEIANREKEFSEMQSRMKENSDKYRTEDEEKEKMEILKDSVRDEVRKYEEVVEVRTAIYRTFSIRSFGTYNCDYPLGLPKGGLVFASFTDPDGKALQFVDEISLFQLSNKMMYRYTIGNFKNFRFNPDSKNVLCGVTTDGKLAYFNANDFKKVKTSGEYTFVMRILSYKIYSTDDLDVILGLG
jgi:hypothetical protein